MKRSLFRQCGQLLASTGLALVALSIHASPSSLVFNTEEYPPFNFTNPDGVIDGISTRLLEAALDDAGLTAHFRVLPWARAYTEARLRRDHCVYSTVRSTEREDDFQWVGPLVMTDWAAFALTGNALEVASLEELDDLRVGSFREDAVGRFVEQQGFRVLLTATDQENLLRLQAGLIDVWVTGELTARHIAADAGVEIERLFTFNRVYMYLACHPSVSDERLARLQSSLDTLRANGRDVQIRQRMLDQWGQGL